MTYKELSYSDLKISASDIYVQMGYDNHVPDAAVRSEMSRIVEEVKAFLHPRYCFMVKRGSLSVENEELTMGQRFAIGKIIARQLRGSEAFALFICTAGTEYEDYQRRLMRDGDMVRVFIADALGSVIAEKCADQMELSLQESIDKLQWNRTNRFSPGYCGWHVSEQQKLFPLFNQQQADSSGAAAAGNGATIAGNPCGVELTASSLMTPIKSVSGIIGVGPKVRYLDYTCGLCDFKNCFKKRMKQRK
ncbi:MAG: methionine synthase [Prevotella sp.]|nr:methionine synthase [Prevotella sp.]